MRGENVRPSWGLSAEVTAFVQYGPSVRTLTTMLSVDHKMPLE